MKYTRLGKTGLKVSRICLGCMSFGDPARKWIHPWVLNEEQSRPFFKRAIEAGINFFDTANIYSLGSSEEITGKLLKEFTTRDEVIIATKVNGQMRADVNGGGLSRRAILTEIDHSLKRLGVDYVDLYQIHRWDNQTPIEETLEALNDVVRAGKARYIGASSMWAWQFAKALHISEVNGWARFVSMQNYYNLIYREEEREMMPLCASEGVGVIPWSPLARGRLTRSRAEAMATNRAGTDEFGKKLYKRTEEADSATIDRLEQLSKSRGKPMAQLALAWMLTKPFVHSPIIGATKIGQLDDAIAAVELELSSDEIKPLEELYAPHPNMGFE